MWRITEQCMHMDLHTHTYTRTHRGRLNCADDTHKHACSICECGDMLSTGIFSRNKWWSIRRQAQIFKQAEAMRDGSMNALLVTDRLLITAALYLSVWRRLLCWCRHRSICYLLTVQHDRYRIPTSAPKQTQHTLTPAMCTCVRYWHTAIYIYIVSSVFCMSTVWVLWLNPKQFLRC